MGKRRAAYVLNSSNYGQAARTLSHIIMKHDRDNPCPREKLEEDTGYTKGQISSIIKYMRRCSEKDLELYIRWYPISSKKGYFFPKVWNDFAPCYATLEKWLASLKRTIEPMREKMLREGIDWRDYLPKDEDEDIENYLADIPEMGKSSWFYENDTDD